MQFSLHNLVGVLVAPQKKTYLLQKKFFLICFIEDMEVAAFRYRKIYNLQLSCLKDSLLRIIKNSWQLHSHSVRRIG